MRANTDPTRAQMRKYLIGIWPAITCERFNRRDECQIWDLEMAMYYFAREYYDGQRSNLYSVLSTSEYRPGACESGFDDASTREENYTAFSLYCALIRHFIKGRG